MNFGFKYQVFRLDTYVCETGTKFGTDQTSIDIYDHGPTYLYINLYFQYMEGAYFYLWKQIHVFISTYVIVHMYSYFTYVSTYV